MMIVAGTGHRPNDLPCKYSDQHPWKKAVTNNLYAYLLDLFPNFIISGMALGWDMWLAEAAYDMKIPLLAYIPFRGQELRWSRGSQLLYQKLLRYSDKIKFAANHFSIKAYQERNELMVNDCDTLLALHSGKEHGGTWNCLEYCKTKFSKKEIINFWI